VRGLAKAHDGINLIREFHPGCWLLLGLFWLNGHAHAAQPDKVLQRTIRFSDFHRILSLPFAVPLGTRRISMKFSYSQKDQRTALDFGLLGPGGFRGWSGGDKDGFTLSLSDATPSYLPGPIEPGRWTLLVGVPNIRRGVASELRAEIYFDRSRPQQAQDPLLSLSMRKGPSWYRGDLHMHTAHSDGSCRSKMGQIVPCPLFLTVEAAVARGLDFIAVTDHNTQSQYNAERELQPYFDNILLLPGREITTYQGHANLFGTTTFLDFRIGTPEVPDVNSMLRRVADLGAIISINHPASHSGENCMGCGWTPSAPVDYHLIQGVEAVNGTNAEGGVVFWQGLLNQGYHLTAIGGSDNHNAEIAVPGPGSVGYPTTVVRAADLSTASILDGIRAGHVFIDTEGTRNRLLEYPGMGDELAVAKGASVPLRVHVMHVNGAHLKVIADGLEIPVGNAAVENDDQTILVEVNGNDQRKWIRVDVCAPDDHRLLIGNPIYLTHRGVSESVSGPHIRNDGASQDLHQSAVARP
jgi:predicted metal-dependent phosphoesterase TrpH